MRVLIVEDDSALGHFLGQGLTLDGYEVELAADGEAALALTARVNGPPASCPRICYLPPSGIYCVPG